MPKRKSASQILLYLLLFFLVWTLRASVFYFVDTDIESNTLRNIYSNAVKLIVWVLPVFFYLKYFSKENPLTKLKLTTSTTKRHFLYATLAIIVYFTGLLIFEFIVSGKTLWPLFDSTPAELIQAFALVSISPIFEEILFRGFILNECWEIMSFWKANLLTSILFVLAHYPNWLWVNGFQPWILFLSLSIFALSLFLGWLVKKTDSLYPSMIAHVINNFLVGFLRN